MATRKPKAKGAKKMITPAVKRRIEKNRRDLASGKGIPLGDLLIECLKRDARRNAA